MTVINKNNTTFNIDGEHSNYWYSTYYEPHGLWENDTFNIIDNYSDQNGIYIDIGAWIGPTVLYAANKYNKIICLEPDPIAIQELELNLSVNNFNNITLVKKALSNSVGHTKLGGNGPLGNSESTMLVTNPNYSEECWGGRHTKEERQSNIVDVETITLDKLLEDENINVQDIKLIKMDIEGGEFIVVPYLQDFLTKHKPVFYISLHRCFLTEDQINGIIDILFNIYDKCYTFDWWSTNKTLVTKEFVIANKIDGLVFE